MKIEIGTNIHYKKKESKVKVKEMNDLSKYGSWEKLDEFTDDFTDDSSDISSEEVNDPQENCLEPSTPPTIQDNFLEEGEVLEEEERFDTPPAIRSLGRRAGQPRKGNKVCQRSSNQKMWKRGKITLTIFSTQRQSLNIIIWMMAFIGNFRILETFFAANISTISFIIIQHLVTGN